MKMTILAIDGSKAMRFLLQTVLGEKYNVVTASDGTAAMYWLSKKNNPDLIIIDPQLSDGQNWEMVEFLSCSGLYGEIPLMVLSALNKTEVENKCDDLGIEHYCLKPFNPIEFLKMVDAKLRGQLVHEHSLKAV
jgi:two-component system, chemotaxis family, chemotaxis protein CheY